MATRDIKLIPVSKLLLDPENPRHSVIYNQIEAIKALTDSKRGGEKQVALASSIVDNNGLNPSKLLIVMPADHGSDEYIVLEGNRRLAVLKILLNPKLDEEIENEWAVKKFRELRKTVQRKSLLKALCVIFPKREDASYFIELEHTGANEGAGVVDWRTLEIERFKERFGGPTSMVLQFLRFARDHAIISDELKAKCDSVPATNLTRLLSDPDVRDVLGIQLQDGLLWSDLEIEETSKGVGKIISDFTVGDKKVADIYTKNDRKRYLNGFGAIEVPDKSKSVEEPWILAEPGKQKKRKRKPRRTSPRRTTMVPSRFSLDIPQSRISKIFTEMQKLNVEKFTNSCAILLRVFFELSVDHYIDNSGGVLIRYNDEKLHLRIKKVSKYFLKNGQLSKSQGKPIIDTVSNKNSIFSINTLNAYMHNEDYNPVPTDLIATWDNFQPLVEVLWVS